MNDNNFWALLWAMFFGTIVAIVYIATGSSLKEAKEFVWNVTISQLQFIRNGSDHEIREAYPDKFI